MSFLQWKKDKLKIGKITFFKVKSFQGMFIYYFLGIPVWSRTTPISRIIYEFQKNKNFDTRNFDKELERIIPPVKSMDSSPYTTRVSVGSGYYTYRDHWLQNYMTMEDIVSVFRI